MGTPIQQVLCIHREKGTPYVVPVPANSYAEAAARAARAGHVVAAEASSEWAAANPPGPIGGAPTDRAAAGGTDPALEALRAEVAGLRRDQRRRSRNAEGLVLVVLLVLSAVGGVFLPVLWIVTLASVALITLRLLADLFRLVFRRE